MAAATENGTGRSERVFGNKAVMYCNITWSAGDTFDTGYAGIEIAWFTPNTFQAGAIGITKSNGQITRVSASDTLGSLTGDLYIIGAGGN